jgi:hypothetical protein
LLNAGSGYRVSNECRRRYRGLLAEDPEIVVVEWRFRDFPTAGTIAAIPLVKQLTGRGYHNTNSFCGGLVRPGRDILEWECDLIYQANQMSGRRSAPDNDLKI